MCCFLSEIIQPRMARLQLKASFGAHTFATQSQIPTDNAITTRLLRLLPPAHRGGGPAPLTIPTTAIDSRVRVSLPRSLVVTRSVPRAAPAPVGARRALRSTSTVTVLPTCGPSIGAGTPADKSLVAGMATARERGIHVAALRATDTTTSGGSGAGHLGLGRDVWQGGRRGRFMCFFECSVSGQGHVYSA